PLNAYVRRDAARAPAGVLVGADRITSFHLHLPEDSLESSGIFLEEHLSWIRRLLMMVFSKFMRVTLAAALFCAGDFRGTLSQQAPPHRSTLLDAHNCYPYYEWWFDRIDRALSAGTPLAIEQDLLWAKNPHTGKMASVLSHGGP